MVQPSLRKPSPSLTRSAPTRRRSFAPICCRPWPAESWFAGQSVTAAGSDAASEWDTVATANGKVKVWYRTAVASHAAHAVAIADAINQTIWPQLTGLMREPLPDCGASCSTGGGDDRIDIYLVNVRRNYSQPFTCCNGSSGFAVIRPDTSFAYVARTHDVSDRICLSHGFAG